jgi:hypothetical protein
MFLGLGQGYEDILASGGYDPTTGSAVTDVISVADITPVVSSADLSAASPGAIGANGSGGGLLPVLTSLVSGAASVITSYLNVQAVKTQAVAGVTATGIVPAGYMRSPTTGQLVPISSVYPSGLPSGYSVNPTTGQLVASSSLQAGLFSGSNLYILAIVGIGAFLMLRGKKNGTSSSGKKRRRRS